MHPPELLSKSRAFNWKRYTFLKEEVSQDPDAGKGWRQEKKGMTEDGIVGWHHRLNGHEFEQAPGDGEGQGSLVRCSPWGYKKSDTTEWLNIKMSLGLQLNFQE